MHYRNGLSVQNGASCDHCVDIQHAVVGRRAAISASSDEGSLLNGVWISSRAVSVWRGDVSASWVMVAHSSDDRDTETAEVGGDEVAPMMAELLQLREFPKRWAWKFPKCRSRDEEGDEEGGCMSRVRL